MDDNNYSNSNNQGFTQPPSGGYDMRPPYSQPPEMTVKDWVITSILVSIPCVNLIMLFIWAFSGTNETRSNFSKGYLIATAIMMVIGVVLGFIFSASIAAMFGGMYY